MTTTWWGAKTTVCLSEFIAPYCPWAGVPDPGDTELPGVPSFRDTDY